VIEAGCGHGVLLCELQKRGYDCLGVEISEDVSDWVREKTGLKVLTGSFPEVALPECDLFLAFDVIEHVPDPLAFLRRVQSLLTLGGIAILQQPTIRPGEAYRLNSAECDCHRMFDDVEHLWIFSSASLGLLADAVGLRILDDEARWRQCHEIVVLAKEKR